MTRDISPILPGTPISRRAALGLFASGSVAALSGCKKPAPEQPGKDTSSEEPEPTAEALERPSLFAMASLPPEPTVTAAAEPYAIGPGLANVDVPSDFFLGEAQLALLEQQGFFVDGDSWNDEFYPVYEANRYHSRANLVTVDSLMHTYHLYFQHLLKELERSSLRDSLAQVSGLMRDASLAQLDSLRSTEWEGAARADASFFAVGAALLDPDAAVSDELAETVSEEVARIESASGAQQSLITGEVVDYTQFVPRGYYAGDETLERYFRAMMWYGQVSFYQRIEDHDRSALLMTLALDGEALAQWEKVYAITSFFAGVSDDCGYYEYRPAIDQAYGATTTVADLPGNDEAWQSFRTLIAQMPAPQINSLPGGNAQELGENRCYRFMGQRFSIDAAIFQQLIYSNVGDAPDGSRRMLPDALDIPAAFGSDEALTILDANGATAYPNYRENLDALRTQVETASDTFWQASLYNQWLLTLRPLLEPKGEGYPTFMQSTQWVRKSIESFLGSYTELKHDTVLYAKQAMAEGDGPIPEERDDRGYVEAEPLVFARLACLCSVTSQGLAHMEMIGPEGADDLQILEQLASQLAAIAAKELGGELPNEDEFELVRSIGVQLEHFWEQAWAEDAERTGNYLRTQQYPASLVVDVATGGDSCLELACGKVRTLYAVVPVEGSLRVASGPVFGFYQFEQPASQRLTDPEWREMLQMSYSSPTEATTPEPWTSEYLFRRNA